MPLPKGRANQKARGKNGKPIKQRKDGQERLQEEAGEKTAAFQSSIPGLQTLEPVRSLTFPIVGIGTSAGGLEALEGLIKPLRVDNMAFVVVQHLSPQHESALASLLSRFTALRVVTATNGVKVEPNYIYVIPPHSLLWLENGVLRVDQANWGGERLTIDFFFRSLAKDQGPGAIGVILSGTGTDGTFGIAEIKAAGGIAFVQDPSTAMYGAMPQSALDSGYADFSLPPERIAEELMRVSHHPYVASTRPLLPTSKETFSKILSQLRHSFNVDFDMYKSSTIERRIERRMALNRIERVEEYLKLLQGNPTERSTLFKDLLISVTSYFRDREPFDALKTLVFPKIMEVKERGSSIRIWVPGCSTGEEAYSIAMCLLEFIGDKISGHKIQIFATDVDSDPISFARIGLYPQNIELDVSPERLKRFFSKRDNHYQVSKHIRDMVVFAAHDLSREPPFSRLDLISCRNVLIYMQPGLQRKVLRIFHYALNPSAFLLLGNSETVGEASGLFSLADRKLKLYTRTNTPVAAAFDLRLGHEAGLPAVQPAPREVRHVVGIQQLADRTVLDRYAPPGVLVNENMEVLQFRGKTGEFLEPVSGGASLNLLKLIRPELVFPLRSTIASVQQSNRPASSEPIQFSGDKSRRCSIEVLPVQESGSQSRSFLVLFKGPPAASVPIKRQGARPPADSKSQALARELATTKEYLQSVIEELESANEELQATNEELQSANEELQSTNEELQTSKEELQSTNEELATVNEELENRMLEATQIRDDLQNIIEVIETPVILLGMDLRIRGLTASTSPALALSSGDIGRPISHFIPKSDGSTFEASIAEVINSVKEKEQRLEGKDGRSYLARIKPYKTSDHRIKGAVISLVRSESSSIQP